MLNPPAHRRPPDLTVPSPRLRRYRKIIASTIAIIAIGVHSGAVADLAISFVESTPKDRFVITNQGSCTIASLRLEIDLSSSAGQLIFDTTAFGAGVEVYQPFEVRTGRLQLVSGAVVNDGDKALTISINSIDAGESVSFTIDVDDTLADSPLGNIRVDGSEIAETRVSAMTDDAPAASARLSANGKATLGLNSCS